MAQNARSQAVLVLTVDRSQLSLGTRTLGCQQFSAAQLHAARCRCGGHLCLSVSVLLALRWPLLCAPGHPGSLETPARPRPPGPAPASSSPPTATKGKPHPDLHLGRGVRAGNLPHSLALEGYPPTPGGLGSLRAPSDGICGNRPSSPASLHFYDPMVLSHHGRRPWGPRAPLQRPGRDSGHSGTEGAGLG